MEQTKLMYEEPFMTVLMFETIDVITLSGGTEGKADKDSFGNMFGKF